MSKHSYRSTSTRAARIARQDMEQAARALRLFAYVPAPAASTHSGDNLSPREKSLAKYWAEQRDWCEEHTGAVAWSNGKAIYPGLVFITDARTREVRAIGL